MAVESKLGLPARDALGRPAKMLRPAKSCAVVGQSRWERKKNEKKKHNNTNFYSSVNDIISNPILKILFNSKKNSKTQKHLNNIKPYKHAPRKDLKTREP